MKGGIVAMIYAILAIRECGQGLSGKVGLMLVPDEETGRRKARRRYDDNELLETAHGDLQRSALPGDFEWRHPRVANQGKQPDCDQRTRFAHKMLATDINPDGVLSQRI